MMRFVRIVNIISMWLGRIVSPLLGVTMLIIVFEIRHKVSKAQRSKPSFLQYIFNQGLKTLSFHELYPLILTLPAVL